MMAHPPPSATPHNTKSQKNMRFVPVTVPNQAPGYSPAPVFGPAPVIGQAPVFGPAPVYGPPYASHAPAPGYAHQSGHGYGTTYSQAPSYGHAPAYGPPPGYSHAPGYDIRLDSGSAVRNTVRNMVGNLEHVITNLHGIVGDLRVLVQQIDVVTNKIGGQYGVYWEKSGLNHVSTTQEKVSKGKDMDSFGLCRWKLLREKYDSTDYSPDIDWSYLGLGECNNNPPAHKPAISANKLRNRKLRRVKHIDTSADSSGVSTDCDIEPNNDFRLDTGKDTATTKASKITFDLDSDINFDCLEMDGHSSDIDCDSKRGQKSRPASQNSPVPHHVFCKDITGSCPKDTYCGVYEAIMESELEALSNCDANSTFSDGDEEVQSVADDPPSVTSLDFKAEYDRHVNPWKSFGFVQIDSTHGSDEILSESASDILNDNYLETHYINPGFDDVHPLIQQTIC